MARTARTTPAAPVAAPVAYVEGRNVSVRIAEDTPEARTLARKLAMGEAHTPIIGKLLRVSQGPAGTVLTWGPVTRRNGSAPAAPAPAPVAAPVAPVEAFAPGTVAAILGTLTREDVDAMGGKQARVILASAVEAFAKQWETAAPIVPTAPAAPRPARSAFVEAQVAKQTAKRAAIVCDCCQDIGYVRGVGSAAWGVAPAPDKGKRPAWAYRTAVGAEQALAGGRAIPCPAHKGGKRGKRTA